MAVMMTSAHVVETLVTKKSFTADTVAKWRVRKFIQTGPSPSLLPPTYVDSFVAAGGVTQHCLGKVRGG